MSRSLCCALILIVGGCSQPPAAAPEPLFGPVSPVSQGTSNGATPSYVTTPGGGLILSWVSAVPGGRQGTSLRIGVRKGGMEYPRYLSFTDGLGDIQPHGEAPPQLAAGPKGDIYALYTVGKDIGKRYPASALRFVRSFDGGTSWSEPMTLNEGEDFGSHNFQSITAGNGKDVYVTWLSNTGKAAVWLRISHDGGKVWDPARVISTGEACPCCRTAVAVAGDSSVYLAWRDVSSTNVRDIVVSRSGDDGATWSTPVKPRDHGWVFPGCPHAGPSLKTDRNGTVHLAWWTGKAGESGVWYARSLDRGLTWIATAIDTTDAPTPAHVQLSLDVAGRVVVGWDGGKGALPQIFVRASGDRGVSFGPQHAVSDANVAATFPVLAIQGDSLSVAWSQAATQAYRAVLEQQKEPEGAHERMQLPQVGQQEVYSRGARLSALIRP